MKSCNIIGRCRNRETGLLTSRFSQLHLDLLNIGKTNKFFDRKKANSAFFLSLSSEFLDRYDESLIFDSEALDAEPVLASFYEVAKEVLPEVKLSDIRDVLAKKFQEGVYSYEEASNKMISFNKEMQGAHTFMGTLERLDDGRYKFKVTYNTRENQEALMLTLADKNFLDLIEKKLNKLGIAIEAGDKSQYSTERFNRLSNGLLGIVKLKLGSKITTDLAKETGHVIIGTLGKENPLVQRLTAIAEKHPEVMAEIIGRDEWVLIENLPKDRRVRELIGHTVGKYLEDEKNLENTGIKNSIKRLVTRIIDYVKAKFAFTDRDYKLALYDAKYLSYKAARDFLGSNFLGTLDNALNTRETLEAESDAIRTEFEHILDGLKELEERSKDWGYALHKDFLEAVVNATTQYNEGGRMISEGPSSGNYFNDDEVQLSAVKTLIKCTRFVINRAKEALAELLIAESGRDPLTDKPLQEDEICKIIRKNGALANELERLLTNWAEIVKNFRVSESGGGADLKVQIQHIVQSLQDTLNGLPVQSASGIEVIVTSYKNLISRATQKLAAKLITKINGNDFLLIEKHVSMTSFGKVTRHNSKIIDLKEELKKTDINPPLDWLSRYILAMADSPSIINQMISSVIEEKKHEANIKTLNDKDTLFNLYQKLRQYGIDSTAIFMEKNDDGELTGNIISERNWGEWEKRYKEAYNQWKERWWEANKHLFKDMLEAFRDDMFVKSKGAFVKDWHRKNSILLPKLDADGNQMSDELGNPIMCHAPVISTDELTKRQSPEKYYDGELYNHLRNSVNPKDALALQWLEEYMTLKRRLDMQLPSGATNSFGVRAPLFQGTFTNKLHGAMGGKWTGGAHIKRIGKLPISHWIILKFSENPSDTEFGGEHNTYDESDTTFKGQTVSTTEFMNQFQGVKRLPLYGVRKLKNQYEISTDLIHSTLAYSAMANNYGCLASVIDQVEVLADQLSELKVQNYKSVKDIVNEGGSHPLTYSRMRDYMNQQVYNIYTPNATKSAWIVGVRKFFNLTAHFGSLYFLEYNWHSAITNLHTGFNEIFKEAVSGEDYNMKDFVECIGIYFGYEVASWFNSLYNWKFGVGRKGHKGSDNESDDKLTLFLKYFDAENSNLRDFRDYHIETPGYSLFKGYSYANIVMLPYSVTDRWMQAISYMATARHTKLRDKNGNECSIWDAYEPKGKTLALKKLKTIDADGNEIEEDAGWMILDKNQKMINEHYAELIASNTVNNDIAPAVYEFDENGALKKDDEGNPIVKSIYIPWDTKAEANFKTVCRGINDRLHGVYNTNDSGAFAGSLLGPSFLALKKYAIGLIFARFARGRYDMRSRKWRQGSFVTASNVLFDLLFNHDISVSGESGAKTTWGNVLLDLALLTGLFLTCGAAAKPILKRRGYSEHQISNIYRFSSNIIMPQILRTLMYIVAPPDELADDLGSFIIKALLGLGLINERENQDFDEDPWLAKLSESMLTTFVKALHLYKNYAPESFLLHHNLTKDDSEYLTEDHFNEVAEKYDKTIPFSIKGILYYQLYRALVEQDAYALGAPKGFLGLLQLYNEYKNLTNSSLMSASAIMNVAELFTELIENKSEEDVDELAEKEGESIYDKYEDSEQELFVRGANEGFKKAAVHGLKVGPLRTPMTWIYGYSSLRSHKFWLNSNKSR